MRYKSYLHSLKKNELINFFKAKKNIIFFDSPFYDCNIKLLSLCDKIIFSDKKTSFIVESSFFRKKIFYLDDSKINYFKYPANNEYYEILSDNKKIFESKNNAKNIYSVMLVHKKEKIKNIIISFFSSSLIFKKTILKYRERNLYIYNLTK